MIICFDCQPGTKTLLDELVASGGYADYADVIAAAVSNQALLHSKVSERGSLIIPDRAARGSSRTRQNKTPQRAQSASGAGLGHTSPTLATERSSFSNPTDGRPHIPELFVLNGLSEAAVPPAEAPDDVWISGQEVPISRWLFGQYNKLLPVKASCRALARLLTAAPDGVALSVTAGQVAEAASHLGDYLAELDRIGGVSRDEALATAFPKTGQGGDKSRLRFANQFVGWTNSHGQLSGLLMGLKLINRTPHKELRIQLTSVGWKLALIRNPILDVDGGRRSGKLSDEECVLLLEHIATSVPAEDFAYRAVLRGIDEGAKTPESLDRFLVRVVPAGAEELTKEFIATQRSGVVSRMIDLGMIARVRDGVRVSYATNERARDYIQQQTHK